MDILLPTIGSAGDVHPVLELGTALQGRGHNVTIITNEFFESQARGAGLDFIALGTVEEANDIIADPRLWHPTKSFDCIVEKAILPNVARLYRIIEERRNRDTIVAASSICFGARIAHEKLGVPLATVHLQPALLRSLVDAGRLGRLPMGPGTPLWLKRPLLWMIDRYVIDRQLAPSINEFRSRLGLAPIQRIFDRYLHSPQLVIGLFADWFAPPQPDWPPHTHLAGFVLHDAVGHFGSNAAAEEFLSAGERPVVFTPGSAAATLKSFFRESAEACRIGGFRGMLITNFPEQLPDNLPSGVRGFAYVPFSQVLPRCAALVYPGGIGTMAQTISAGIPHLVVPHGHDQPDNALRMERLGLGKSVYPERYKGPHVAKLLQEILSSRQIAARCVELAGRIDSQAALLRAGVLLETLSAQFSAH